MMGMFHTIRVLGDCELVYMGSFCCIASWYPQCNLPLLWYVHCKFCQRLIKGQTQQYVKIQILREIMAWTRNLLGRKRKWVYCKWWEESEISFVEDTEVVLQAQLQQKRRVKTEQAGVDTAQGCLSLLTCNLSLVPRGKWGAPNPCYFNLLSVHCYVITGQEHWSNIFFCGPLAVCSFPARSGGIGIAFQLAQLVTLSYRDADVNDKGDLTSAIKQYSFSLTLNKLHSCS